MQGRCQVPLLADLSATRAFTFENALVTSPKSPAESIIGHICTCCEPLLSIEAQRKK